MATSYSSDHALLLFLKVFGEFCPSSVVPDEVGVLRVAVQGLQKLWRVWRGRGPEWGRMLQLSLLFGPSS